jgi:SAM-dependent methyltransferase
MRGGCFNLVSGSVDWGKTSLDYVSYRHGQPESFFRKLFSLGVGLPGQYILDVGTGTGLIARKFARSGAFVAGIDVSEHQIRVARETTNAENLTVDFKVAKAEAIPFLNDSFDCVISSNSWQYFDKVKAVNEIKRILRPNGLLVICYFSWLPRLDNVARASENLALKFNPYWERENWNNSAEIDDLVKLGGVIVPFSSDSQGDVTLRGMFFYDVEIPYTREEWRGRMRASRGIGASLSEEQVVAFDEEHKELLYRITDDEFTVKHRVDAHIYSFKEFIQNHA